jgi:hypothetical protein
MLSLGPVALDPPGPLRRPSQPRESRRCVSTRAVLPGEILIRERACAVAPRHMQWCAACFAPPPGVAGAPDGHPQCLGGCGLRFCADCAKSVDRQRSHQRECQLLGCRGGGEAGWSSRKDGVDAAVLLALRCYLGQVLEHSVGSSGTDTAGDGSGPQDRLSLQQHLPFDSLKEAPVDGELREQARQLGEVLLMLPVLLFLLVLVLVLVPG